MGSAALSVGGSLIAGMLGFSFWVNDMIPEAPGPFPVP